MSRYLGRGFLYRLAPIDTLKPHEQVDWRRVRLLAEDMARRLLVLRPIIVDRETRVIIDGHHRFEALRLLGAKRVPVVAAGRSDIEGVSTWAYLLNPSLSMMAGRLARILRASAGKGCARLTIEYRGRVLASVEGDPVSLHEAASSLVELMGWRPRRVPVEEADSDRWLVVKPPVISHEHVVKLASAGRRLPPKTTCYHTWLKHVYSPTPLSLLL